MKKNCILAGLILMVLFSAVLNSGFVKETKAGNIAGIVVCEGKPLTDVQVSIPGKKAKTDSNGKFFISDIPSGAYIVAVTGDKCVIESFFQPVLGWSDSTTILIFSLDTIPRPALNRKVKVTTEIDSASFVKMDYKHIMELSLSPPKKEVVSDSAKKIIINGDTVIEVRLSRYPEGPIQFDNDQMKITQKKNLGTGNIAGIVVDKQTLLPLSGAVVYVEGMPTIGTKTDTLGRFWLSSVSDGEYSIQASQIGFFVSKILNVKVYNDSTSIILFNLVNLAIPEKPYHSYPWQENKVKCDSLEFYASYYKTLLRKR